MTNNEKWLILVLGIIFFSIVTGKMVETGLKKVKLPERQISTVPSITPIIRQKVKVVRVVDGDTIEIEGGQKVRYIGMDTPETVDPRKAVQCFGKEASIENQSLVEGKEVELEKDVSETDKYGRLLRYVWLDGTMINEKLVLDGYARIETVPPDVKYNQIFINAQSMAKANNRGLWQECK